MRGELTIKVFDSKTGELKRTIGPCPNKVVSSAGYGRNLILRWMAGDATYPIVINSAAVGSGSTAPADGDTGLQTSVHSGLGITNFGVSNNILTVDVFVPDASLTNVTYREFGLFATNRLISRLLISPVYTKVSGEDTLFSYTLTMSG